MRRARQGEWWRFVGATLDVISADTALSSDDNRADGGDRREHARSPS
jgi:hypothetical protein